MKRWLILALCCCACLTAFAREVVPLETGWKFRFGYQFNGNMWKGVTVPHTWNASDPEGAHPYTRTMGQYRLDIPLKEEWKGKRLFLRFKGAATVADVMFNNTWLGQHRGGYTAFCYEITPLADFAKGKKNTLRVRVSNAETSDVIPLSGDFTIFGGLYRGVDLIVTDNVCISPLDYASSGVAIEQKSLSDAEAQLTVRVALSNPTKQEQVVKVAVAGETFEGKGVDEAVIPVTLKNPHRWNGVADPFLYTLTASVGEDSVTETFGVREIAFDANKGFFLNGKHLPLRGVCRHQEWEGLGSALTQKEHERDVEIMREMGANAVRLAHYPQAKEVSTLATAPELLSGRRSLSWAPADMTTKATSPPRSCTRTPANSLSR